MIHHREGLPLRLESHRHLPRVHSRLDELKRHLALNVVALHGKPDDPKSPLSQLAHQFVPSDTAARLRHPANKAVVLRTVLRIIREAQVKQACETFGPHLLRIIWHRLLINSHRFRSWTTSPSAFH